MLSDTETDETTTAHDHVDVTHLAAELPLARHAVENVFDALNSVGS